MIADYSTELVPDPKVSFTTADQLGSPRILTDENGEIISRRDFHPFGEEISSPERTAVLGYQVDDIRQKFTTYERDTETELDYAQARYHNFSLGRFFSIDPENADADFEVPQSWNAYAYTRNNPLKYVDPTGEGVEVCSVDGERDCRYFSERTWLQFLKDNKKHGGQYEIKGNKIYYEGELTAKITSSTLLDESQMRFIRETADQSIRKAKVVGTAAAVTAVTTAACAATAGGGCVAAAGTVLRQIAVRSPAFLRQLAGKDKKILELAFNNAKSGSGSFASNLEAVSKATSQVIPGGNVLRLGFIKGSPVYGGKSGIGIVEIGGKTMVVKKVGETFKVLGEFLGK